MYVLVCVGNCVHVCVCVCVCVIACTCTCISVPQVDGEVIHVSMVTTKDR